MLGIGLDSGFGVGIGGETPSSTVTTFQQANFVAPLTNNLTLLAGSGPATFTRAGATGTVTDFEGNIHTALANEARFPVARRVRNNLTFTEAFQNAAWSKLQSGTGIVPVATDAFGIAPDGTQTASRIQLDLGATPATAVSRIYQSGSDGLNGNAYSNSIFIKTNDGTTRTIYMNGGSGTIAIVINPSWKRFSGVLGPLQIYAQMQFGLAGSANGVGAPTTDNTADILVWHPSSNNLTGASNTNPPEYVSSTWNDTGAAGVRYFPYLNGNTVANNVVTEKLGERITGLENYLDEPSATNYFLNSGTPATQTTGSLGTGTYTCWVKGTGSIAISAGTATITGAGTATSATPLVFNVTVAGTVVCTYTAPLTFVQVEKNSFPTSEIDTAGVAVSRAADLLQYPTAGNILAAQGTMYFEFRPKQGSTATVIYWGSFVDANNYTQIYYNGTQLVFLNAIAGVLYSATIPYTYSAGAVYKVMVSWGTSGLTITVNGVEGTPNASTAALQLAANMSFGGSAAVTFEGAETAGNWYIWPTQLSATVRQALT